MKDGVSICYLLDVSGKVRNKAFDYAYVSDFFIFQQGKVCNVRFFFIIHVLTNMGDIGTILNNIKAVK